MADEQPEAELKSLTTIRAELDVERAAQDSRASSADTRAGLVLGFSGVMAGIAINTKSLLALPGILSAAVAAVIAARVFWPRMQTTINPTALRGRYGAVPDDLTQRYVLDSRIKDYEFNEEQVSAKVTRLKRAILFLTISVVVVLASAALRLILDARKS